MNDKPPEDQSNPDVTRTLMEERLRQLLERRRQAVRDFLRRGQPPGPA